MAYRFMCGGQEYDTYLAARDAADMQPGKAAVTVWRDGKALMDMLVPGCEETVCYTVRHDDKLITETCTPDELYERWWMEDCPLPANDDPVIACTFAGVALEGIQSFMDIIIFFCGTEQNDESGLGYEELMACAKKYYIYGGDAIYECWDERTYKDYVAQFGPVTRRKAREMFRLDQELAREREGWMN